MSHLISTLPQSAAAVPRGNAFAGLLFVVLSSFALAESPVDSDALGKKAFVDKCAQCHGMDGQGGDGYNRPLFGDESLRELGLLIERTMPEGEPEECAGDEAHAVAKFIYGDFYSRDAREAKGLAKAPRLERMRLTVPQYRNTIADLVRHFTPIPRGKKNRNANEASPGIFGQYFDSKFMDKTKKRQMKRVDAEIKFDFGTDAPKDGMDKTQFAIIWDGSIDVRDTGYYEFRVRSPNGVRLYANMDYQGSRPGLRDDGPSHGQAALIDAWVSSSEMREHTARLFLLGGRRYPLRLEFFKYLEAHARIKLDWKPPHGSWAPLDFEHLTTAVSTRTFVPATPFPADDRSFGYERGSSVSHAWHTATSEGAIATANEVLHRLPILAGVDEDTENRQERLREFTLEFAEIAWRRPLNGDEKTLFETCFFKKDADPEVATKRAILFVLNSPYFLYTDLTPEGAAPDQYAMAARLAQAMWDSLPDNALRKAAARGQLNKKSLARHAQRMLDDPRARAKLHGFFHHWLELGERAREKDQKEYPEFDPQVIVDLRRSLELFLDDVVWSDTSDYRQLLLSDSLLLNKRLRDLYGNQEKADSDGFAPVVLSKHDRAGVLTHPYILSALAYADKTSPIHRGVFLTRNIVGRGLNAPPEAVAFKDEEFAADLTMREKVTQLTSSTNCMSCHSIINPLGFALERYDAIGRWRTKDGEKPINTTSQYMASDGKTIDVRNARDVARFAVSDPAAQRAFVSQLFHHVIKQDPFAYGRGTLEDLRTQFAEDEFHIQKLWIAIATQAALHGG